MAVAEKDVAARKREVKRDDVAVKIDRTLADKASVVARQRRTTMAEYLSEILKAPVERDFAKAIRELEGKG
jgi:hypothetical protein